MNPIAVKPPARFADWAELGIRPPKSEYDEAKLVSSIESHNLVPTLVVTGDQLWGQVILTKPADSLSSRSVLSPGPQFLRPAISDSSVASTGRRCIAAVKTTIIDMSLAGEEHWLEPWNAIRKDLESLADKIRGELYGESPTERLDAARLVIISCCALTIPKMGIHTLFEPGGDSPYAEMLSFAQEVWKQNKIEKAS